MHDPAVDLLIVFRAPAATRNKQLARDDAAQAEQQHQQQGEQAGQAALDQASPRQGRIAVSGVAATAGAVGLQHRHRPDQATLGAMGERSAPGIRCQPVWVAHRAQIAIARR